MRPALAAARTREGATDTMTEKQFNEIVARAGQPPLGTSSQVKTDVGDLISEITRRVTGNTETPAVPFEPEPKTEEELAAEAEKAAKKGAKK
jgi:hypothetical protein